jgi:hypothetical protein
VSVKPVAIQYDIEADTIKLQADESLWELYRIDNQVLLQMIVLRRLANKGSARALYTFIESFCHRSRYLFPSHALRNVCCSPLQMRSKIAPSRRLSKTCS